MFTDINPNIKFCIESSNVISSQISSNYINNCSDICFQIENPKIIKEKQICIDNCSFDLEFPYEFNNICYQSCPLDTYISSINDYFM